MWSRANDNTNSSSSDITNDNTIELRLGRKRKKSVENENTDNSDGLNTKKFGDPTKIEIAETIIRHFKEINRELTQELLDTLVPSEYQRIQNLRRSPNSSGSQNFDHFHS